MKCPDLPITSNNSRPKPLGFIVRSRSAGRHLNICNCAHRLRCTHRVRCSGAVSYVMTFMGQVLRSTVTIIDTPERVFSVMFMGGS